MGLLANHGPGNAGLNVLGHSDGEGDHEKEPKAGATSLRHLATYPGVTSIT